MAAPYYLAVPRPWSAIAAGGRPETLRRRLSTGLPCFRSQNVSDYGRRTGAPPIFADS